MTLVGDKQAGLLPSTSPPTRQGVSSAELRALVPGLLVVGLLGIWAAADGGFLRTGWLPGALFLVGLAIVTTFSEAGIRVRLSRLQIVALSALAAFTIWTFLSLTWAEVRGDAWDGANRTLLYLVVVLLFATRPWQPRSAAVVLGAYVCVIVAVGVFEFAQTAVGADAKDFIGGRLARPTGYQNANAALFMMAFLPAVIAASRRALAPAARGLAVAAATFLAQLALLSQSRGSLFTLPLVALAMLVLVPGRVRTAAALALPLVAVVLTRGPLLDVYEAGESEPRLAVALGDAARAMIVSVLVVGALGWLWAVVDRRISLSAQAERRLGMVAGGAVAAGAIAIGALVLPSFHPINRIESGWRQFTHNAGPAPSSSYFLTGLGSYRYDFWRVGFGQFRESPLLGAGAENFSVAYLRERRSFEEPHYPHSLEVRTLGQLGLVGSGLLAVFLGAALLAALPRRGWTRSRRTVAAAALLPFLWWFCHGSVDWFWEFPALTVPALGFLALAGGLRDTIEVADRSAAPRAGLRGLAIAATAAVAVLAAASLAFPWLEARHVASAQSGWREDPNAAYRSLDAARTLNPLTDEPDLVAGAIAARLRDDARARSAFGRVLERNPTNWYAHLELGLLESVAGRRANALSHLRRALTLNPREGLLPLFLERVRKGERVHPSSLDRIFIERARGLVT